ncbi:MAG TPA: hypothetical protein VNO21_10150, partial [Polyangiaceae bacterium]|nr:hypothetical protein [Polyangiaceae bacterium]
MMRLRVRAPLMFFAVSAAGLGLVMAACGLTDDLTGGPVDDGGIDGDIDAGAVTCGTQQCPYGDNSAPICVNGICRVLCTTNWGDCDDSGANGCETPLNTTTNCGRCAHDCLGGGCSNGLCQPRKLAAGRDSPDRIVLDNDYVYGFSAHTGAVTRVPKNGVPGVGAFPTIYREPAQAVPEEIAIANNGLYYTTYGLTTTDAGSFYGHVMYLRPDGGGHAEVAPALSPTVIGAMAVGTG